MISNNVATISSCNGCLICDTIRFLCVDRFLDTFSHVCNLMLQSMMHAANCKYRGLFYYRGEKYSDRISNLLLLSLYAGFLRLHLKSMAVPPNVNC